MLQIEHQSLTTVTVWPPYTPHSGQNVPKLIEAIHNLAFSSIFTRDWNKLYTLGYICCWGCGGLGQNVPIGQEKFLACKDDTSPRCIGNVEFLATHTSSVAFATLGHYISLGHWEVIHVRLCLHLNSWNKLGQYSNGTKCLKNWCKASTASHV